MKRYILFLLLLPVSVLANIDEYKTDIYFANGIDSTREEAWYVSVNVLRNGVKKELYQGLEEELNRHVGKFDLAYNETHSISLDFLEATLQKVSTGIDILDEVIIKAIAATLRSRVLGDFLAESKKLTYEDRQRQIAAYKESIRNGHKVLVVAHSQGNFFTNEAYDRLVS